MINTIYSIGGFMFYSAKELAEFKRNFPNEWEVVKDKPLKLSGLSMEYSDFLDYLNSLQNMPDICLAYQADNARGHGYYTTVWCNGLRINGIFGYHESDVISEHFLFDMISQSKWAGMKIRQNYCR